MGAAAETKDFEMIALAVRRNAVRGREVSGNACTYRRRLSGIIPGHRLTIHLERRWLFRKTELVGGPLLHVGFSLRALQQAGFELPQRTPRGLTTPGASDDRLLEGLLCREAGEWMTARCLLLETLEGQPGCLVAHAALGEMLAELEHREEALSHLTAAIRLGLGAMAQDERAQPLDSSLQAERALLTALTSRARILLLQDRADEAAADLRRALAWDPRDVTGAASVLARLEPERRPVAAW